MNHFIRRKIHITMKMIIKYMFKVYCKKYAFLKQQLNSAGKQFVFQECKTHSDSLLRILRHDVKLKRRAERNLEN